MRKTKRLIAAAASVAILTAGMGSMASADHVSNHCPDHTTGVTDTVGDPETVEYTAPAGFLVAGYCVKAGSANQGDGPVFVTVDPPKKTVTITHPTGKAVSHYSVLLVPEETKPGAWCSPGFWKNSPLQAEATAKLDTEGRLPANWQDILANPQVYGGEAANAIADILSDLHPDVNFTGERVEDSCPLSADASTVKKK